MTELRSRGTCRTAFALFVFVALYGGVPTQVQATLGPTLSNDTVAYRWAPAEQGGILVISPLFRPMTSLKHSGPLCSTMCRFTVGP